MRIRAVSFFSCLAEPENQLGYVPFVIMPSGLTCLILIPIVCFSPERLVERVAAQPLATDVVIDKVQKIPALLNVVHQLVEGERPLRFILTGSSARKLRRGASNLLAGCLTELHMPYACNR